MTRRVPLGLAILLAAILLFAGAKASWVRVTDQDWRVVAELNRKVKTYCIGRFLIDMPEQAELALRQARIDGFEIASFKETEQEFQKRVAEREAQITAKPAYLGGSKNMESARDVTTRSGLVGKIFIHSRTVVEGTQGNGLGGVERYRHEGITTEALVHGQGISIDLFYEDRNPDLVEDLPKLVDQLVANPDKRIPTEPGFCMDRAYVRDPLSADQREQIMMVGRLPDHPDVEIMFIVAAGLKPCAHGLLERSGAASSWLAIADRMRVSTLRAGERRLAAWRGRNWPSW